MARPTEAEVDRLLADEDFVLLPKFNCSVREVLDRYPDGAPKRMIAQGLALDEEQVEELLQQALGRLRTSMEAHNNESDP